MLIKTGGWKWGSVVEDATNSSLGDVNAAVKDVTKTFKMPDAPAIKLSPTTTKKFGVGQAATKKLLPAKARPTQTALLSAIENVKSTNMKPIGVPIAPHTGIPKVSPVKESMEGTSSQIPKAPKVPGGKVAASIKTPKPVAGTASLVSKALGDETKVMTGWTSPNTFTIK